MRPLPSVNRGWKETPLRELFTNQVLKNDGAEETRYLSLLAGRGVIPYEEKGDIGNRAPEDLSKCKRVSRGDFVLNSMNFGIGSFGVSRYEGVCSAVYLVLKPNPSTDPRFLSYVFALPAFQKAVQSLGDGILAHRAAVTWGDLKNVCIAIPPLEEQRAIADYLDRETAQIDELVSKLNKADSLLGDRLVSARTELTRQGLSKNVEFKGTGRDDLGVIPRHWKLIAIRRIAQIRNGADYKAVEVTEGGYPVYGSGGEFRRSSEFLFDGTSVLFGRKGTIDRPLLVSGRFWTVDTMFYSEIDQSQIDPEYFHAYATTMPFSYYSTSTALPSMTQQDLLSHVLPIPEKGEQERIVVELRGISAQVAISREKVAKLIETVLERRAALITAAVTGQIDVGTGRAA